jgi:hypothetical protein
MLISPEHAARYQQYYAAHFPGALRPHAWQHLVERLIAEVGATSVLDYGCGPSAALAWHLHVPVQNYDPGVVACAALPSPADVVVCVHTLEHVEPECLPEVLHHLWGCTRKAALLIISCQPSTKVLPDGIPWHTCVREPIWWQRVLEGLGRLVPLTAADTGSPQTYGCFLYREGVHDG